MPKCGFTMPPEGAPLMLVFPTVFHHFRCQSVVLPCRQRSSSLLRRPPPGTPLRQPKINKNLIEKTLPHKGAPGDPKVAPAAQHVAKSSPKRCQSDPPSPSRRGPKRRFGEKRENIDLDHYLLHFSHVRTLPKSTFSAPFWDQNRRKNGV